MFVLFIIDERWVDIQYKNIKPLYQISNYGRIRNKQTDKILSIVKSEKGYSMVGLYTEDKRQKTLKVHRLMGFHFLKLPDFNDGNLWTVNHKNGCKDNNTETNLEWIPFDDNIRHARDTGLWKPNLGENNGSAIHSEETIRRICELIGHGHNNRNIRIILEDEGVQTNKLNKYTFHDLRRGKIWKHISREYFQIKSQ